MVRTTITTTVSAEAKAKALPIIRYKLRKSFSEWIDEKMLELIQKQNTKEGKYNE